MPITMPTTTPVTMTATTPTLLPCRKCHCGSPEIITYKYISRPIAPWIAFIMCGCGENGAVSDHQVSQSWAIEDAVEKWNEGKLI